VDRLDFLFATQHKSGKYIPPHLHECYELVYYFQGTGITKLGSDTHPFETEQFALISPQIVHDEKHSTDADVLFIGFHTNNAAIENLNGIFEDDRQQTVRQLVLRMKLEFELQQDGYTEMLNLLVGELVIHLQRTIGVKIVPDRSEDQLQYVLNYMDEHYRQKISVESLAQMSGYSYDRFRHLFKEKYGIAPLQYLYVKRLDYAKTLLLDTQMLVSDIASDAGFVNDAQFCSMFKRETGITPKTYRNVNAE